MKSLVTLHLAVLQDAGLLCATHVQRDEQTLLSRWEHEGDSFLTITLPTLAKALEKGLADGQWPRHSVTGFDHWRGLPRFLGGFLARVFSQDGKLLDDPDVDSIWAVRQICNLTGKLERDCTPERVQAAFSQFIQTDVELAEHFLKGIAPEKWSTFNRWTLYLFGDLFDKLETLVAEFALIPRHGPGAVAEKLSHLERWDFEYWTERLEEVFPHSFYAQNVHRTTRREHTTPSDEIPVRVISVPKTQKTPRIIAIEPSTVQFAQQGLKREIYAGVEESWLARILGFTDQTRNQDLAREGSISGDLATLDLSEASDRVHAEVAEELFRYHPHLRDFVMATRSTRANVNGEVFRLAKFASMGSALTFPVEAMIFTIISAMGVWGSEFPARRVLPGKLSVYGDDIIVPVEAVDRVIDNLESFGFKVNQHKSFWTGKFRESCGTEFYDGTDVSVVRLRAEVPTSRGDAALINRFVDFRNRCYRSGLWRTVKASDEQIDKIMNIPSRLFSESDESVSVMAKDSVLRPKWRGRWNADYHTWEERFPRAVPQTVSYTVDGESGLLKWFLENHDRTDRYQTDRYEGQERAHTFRIKWVGIPALAKA